MSHSMYKLTIGKINLIRYQVRCALQDAIDTKAEFVFWYPFSQE